jgi:D-cysteine desulfhydrase
VFARKFELPSRGLLVPQVDVPEVALNKRLLQMYGMEVIRCRRFVDVPRGYLEARYSKLNGRRPFWIPPGSAHSLGVLAIVEAALEVARAIRTNEIPQPDDVVVATGTCATATGLLLGFAMARLPIRVVAARVVPTVISGPWKLRQKASQTLKILRACGFGQPIEWGPLLWVNSTAAPSFGVASLEAQQAMEEASYVGGLRCDTTYTGKTLALFRSPPLAGRRVLFWNTLSAVTPPDLSESVDESGSELTQSGRMVPSATATGEQM